MTPRRIRLVILLVIFRTSQANGLYEDDYCANDDGSEGICKKGSECPAAEKAMREKKYPKTCGFIGKEIILCCPQEKYIPEPDHNTATNYSNEEIDPYNIDDLPEYLIRIPRAHHMVRRQQGKYGRSGSPNIFFPGGSTRRRGQPTNRDGDSCRNNDGTKGICRKEKDCPTLEQAIKARKHPRLCNYENRIPTFCCPVLSESTSDSSSKPLIDMNKAKAIAKQKCAEYGKLVIVEIDSPAFQGEKEYINQCAIIEEPLIVGGQKTKPKEFPHMALIGYGADKNSVIYNCGGSLISERFVLTAAHCNPKTGPPSEWVKLGELNTASDEDDADPQVFKVINKFNHPDYNDDKNLYNDISLFQLEKDVKFNAYIRPICLSIKSTPDTQTAIATGWGHTTFGGVESESMLKVRLDLINNLQCSKKVASRQLPKGVRDTQLCAGGQEGKDACQGDSGGPLQNTLTEPFCMYELLGITSFGKGCGLGYPGLYTRVSSYLPWIVSQVWPE